MQLITILSPLVTLFFGALVLYISHKNNKERRLQEKQAEDLKKQLLETTILRDIQDKISYSLSLEKTVDLIIHSLHALFPDSNIGTVSRKKGKTVFQLHARQRIGKPFVQYVKTNLLASFPDANKQHEPEVVEECVFEEQMDASDAGIPGSFIRVPFIVNKEVAGVIGLASKELHRFSGEDIRILDQLVGEAGVVFSRIQSVVAEDEEKSLAIIESLPEGIIMVDEQHTLRLINVKAKKLLGFSGELPTTHEVASMLPQTLDLSELLRETLLYEKSTHIDEVILHGGTISLSAVPIYVSYSRTVAGALLLLRDIHAEKAKEQEKEDFTNIMVHELRSPLTAIKGASQFLKANPKIDDASRERLLSVIDTQAKELLEQISAYLDAARIDAGRFTLMKATGSLKQLIDARIQLFTPQAQAKQLTIHAKISESLPLISFDAMRIDQVLNDLLSNSIKYTQPGGEIIVSAVQAEGEIIVSVKDNGIGIPKEKQPELFTKFARTNRQVSPVTKHVISTGLGLYIAKGIIEAHGGRITVTSDLNQGTTVSFTLPFGDPGQQIPAASLDATAETTQENLHIN